MSAEERAKEWLGEYEQTAAYRQQGWSDTVIAAYLAGRKDVRTDIISEFDRFFKDANGYTDAIDESFITAIKAL